MLPIHTPHIGNATELWARLTDLVAWRSSEDGNMSSKVCRQAQQIYENASLDGSLLVFRSLSAAQHNPVFSVFYERFPVPRLYRLAQGLKRLRASVNRMLLVEPVSGRPAT